jgi:hypothetical protein
MRKEEPGDREHEKAHGFELAHDLATKNCVSRSTGTRRAGDTVVTGGARPAARNP